METKEASPVTPGPAPSIGSVVWYYPHKNTTQYPSYGGQPHSASVAFVHSHTCVNLGVIDSNGVPYGRTSVSLYHPEGVPDWQKDTGGYATWMPYQVK